MPIDANKLANRSLNPKRVDNFYVKFFLPENVSNLLGRQMKSITRPTITIESTPTFHKGKQYQNNMSPRFNPVTAVLSDDESGLTSMVLYSQIMRQQNRLQDIYGREDAIDRVYRFDVEINTYDSRDRLTESYVLKNCFISSIEHSQPILQSDEDNEITIELTYDNIDIRLVDQYEELTTDPNFGAP